MGCDRDEVIAAFPAAGIPDAVDIQGVADSRGAVDSLDAVRRDLVVAEDNMAAHRVGADSPAGSCRGAFAPARVAGNSHIALVERRTGGNRDLHRDRVDMCSHPGDFPGGWN